MEIYGKRITITSLAIPIFIEFFLRALIGTVNIFIIGKYSDNAAASVGVANQVINLVIFIFNVISMGAAVVITQNLGAGRSKAAGDTSMSTIGINFAIGLLISVILVLFGRNISGFLSLKGDLLEATSLYLRWTGACMVLTAVSMSITIIFRCYGDSKTPMVAVTTMNILNLAGNYLVVFRPFEIPLYGVGGVAQVRLICEAMGVCFLIIQLIRAQFGFAWKEFFLIKKNCIKDILYMGIITGLEGTSYNLAQIITTGAIVVFGASVISTRVYVQNVCSLVLVLGTALGQGNQIMVGHLVGAGKHEEAYKMTNRNFLYILASHIGLILIVLALTRPIIGLFTNNSQIIQLAFILIMIEVLIQAGRSFNHAFNFSLKGTGFVVAPMIISVICIWSIQVGIGYYSARTLGWGLIGVWIAMAIDEWARGLMCFFFWRSRKWQKSSLVKPETSIINSGA